MNLQGKSSNNLWNAHLPNIMEGQILIEFDGTIVFCNHKAESIFNIEHSNIINKDIFSSFTFYSAEDLSLLDKEQIPLIELIANRDYQKEVTLAYKISFSEYKWITFKVQETKINLDSYLVISFIDVTKFIKDRIQLIQKQNQLDFLVSSINDLIFEFSADGTYLNYWTNMPQLLFFDPKEFLNKNIKDLFPHPLADETLKLIKLAAKHGISQKIDFESPNHLDDKKWFRAQIKPIPNLNDRVAVIVYDITKRVNSKEQIRFNEHKFNQAFHYSGLGMAITDLEGHCLEANFVLSKILGFSKEELSNFYFLEQTHPDDKLEGILLREQIINRKIDNYTIRKRYIHKSGHYVWCSVTLAGIQNQENQIKSFIVQIQDISEEIRNLELLEKQNHELEIVKVDLETKVRQLEEFNQIVSHNLRGPVSNIQMLIDGIQESQKETEKDKFYKMLKSSGKELIKTLEELADILIVHENQSISIEQNIFENVFEKVKTQLINDIIDKKAIIETDFQIQEINYPKLYLENIFFNLLSNSLKYINPGKVPIIKINTYHQNGSTILSIQDNGIGIDLPKYKSQLFMFRKIFHRGFDSKGIDLFITRYQIESLGGKIDVISEPEKGSTFFIKF